MRGNIAPLIISRHGTTAILKEPSPTVLEARSQKQAVRTIRQRLPGVKAKRYAFERIPA